MLSYLGGNCLKSLKSNHFSGLDKKTSFPKQSQKPRFLRFLGVDYVNPVRKDLNGMNRNGR